VIVGISARIREAGQAFASNARDPQLLRAQLSFGAGWAAEWAFTVGLSIVAFRDGGAAAVGLVALLRLAPSAVAGPFAATLADRFRRDLIIAWIGAVRTASVGLAALLLALGSSTLPVYALAVIATVAVTPFRAAHSALLPSLCRTPDELTSAMVTRGMLDSLSVLLGPFLAALLLAVGSPAAVFAAVSAASLLSAMLIFRLSYETAPRPASGPIGLGLRANAVVGMRTIAGSKDVALLCGLGAAQAFTRGCLTVFSVVVAIELVKLGASGVGVLNGAVGVGAVLGSLAASLLVGSRRLASWFPLGIASWGMPFALIGAFPSKGSALALLGCVGAANAVVDVSFFSLVGRLVDDALLARVFGVLESAFAIAVGLGAVVTPAVISALGIRGALAVMGSICPVLAVLALARLRMLDRTLEVRTREIELLREVPMLRTLPVVTIEQLARGLRHSRVPEGGCVCVQGGPADSFYVIESGEAEVLGDGKFIRMLGPGDYFGEIALLRDVARTATVRARTVLLVSELRRELFLPVVSGYAPSFREADVAIRSRLATFRPPGALA
jgi:MFS family permease